jgi:hypothetical protein
VTYCDLPGGTLDDLRREVIQATMVDHVEGFILDNLQLIRGKPRGVSTSEHIDGIAQWCADVCKQRNLWCIILAQLNQEGGTRGSEGPLMSGDQVYRLDRPDHAIARGAAVPASTPENAAWLEMLATRYTRWLSVGTASAPAFMLNEKIGPYFEECDE